MCYFLLRVVFGQYQWEWMYLIGIPCMACSIAGCLFMKHAMEMTGNFVTLAMTVATITAFHFFRAEPLRTENLMCLIFVNLMLAMRNSALFGVSKGIRDDGEPLGGMNSVIYSQIALCVSTVDFGDDIRSLMMMSAISLGLIAAYWFSVSRKLITEGKCLLGILIACSAVVFYILMVHWRDIGLSSGFLIAMSYAILGYRYFGIEKHLAEKIK